MTTAIALLALAITLLFYFLSDATVSALILGIPSIIASLTALIVAIRGIGKGNQKIDKVGETVGRLATNIDGAMTEIKETIAAKSLAEGQLKGIAGEQARTAEMITEPVKVAEALNGKEVREQINNIENAVNAAGDIATAVAEDLAKAHERADAHATGESGEAADAAARLTGKEKELLGGEDEDQHNKTS